MAKDETIGQVRANLKAANVEARQYLDEIHVLKDEIARQVAGARTDEHAKIASLASVVEALSQLVKDAYDHRAK